MKIIHFADLHIGSKFDRMPDDIKTELNTKLRNAFAKIIDYAKVNKYILIATYYANKILELNIKENRENKSKKLTK